MKKIFIYIFIIICLVFLIPFVLTCKFPIMQSTIHEQEEAPEEMIDKNPYNYKDFGTIKLLDSKTNVVSEVNLDEYLLRCSISRNASKL